mmetsp:Transcript_26306/g.53658  ORF Transcript_26306/g.53658 Transcript_26306/m.53658 type:complete len:401 (-) Transcript_26306:220-1422(-)|eukprot:CAMPEP_0181305478 /NCGR_PEP_ID=MMETSP1101-20121128/9753_1 /TAXON_ID=46948 /ORGANISM="Rhodomonas abbreviata, Strain Caron Lab Isolate" /LENGTH=400 /DNA_ID=CAMNT_0023411401 /DNA_START=96 /DNA_END=1298 /DNA_ORIENTATION=-
MIDHGQPFIMGEPQFLKQGMGMPMGMGAPMPFVPPHIGDPLVSTAFSLSAGGLPTAVFSDMSLGPVQPDSNPPSSVEPQQASCDEHADIKHTARQWALREGFNQEKLTEFGHLMSMVSATYIAKSKLSKLTEIDSGSFGKIYSSKYDGSKVAVKQMSNNGENTIAAKMRELLLELRVLVRVRHPHVVTFWGSAVQFPTAEDQTQPYIGLVFELCEKGSLHNALFESKQALSMEQRIKVAHQCAMGLAYLHSKRVIHRDINPRNILLSQDLSAKIADFGCARVLSGKSLRTTTISGSPAYMAPEQLQGQELTEAVDTWALASMLWEIMMLQKPWEGRFSDFNLLKAAIIRGEKLHMPAQTRFPSCYVNMIKLGTQSQPENRPSMHFVASELEKALKSVSHC